jgi:hypothetical protein
MNNEFERFWKRRSRGLLEIIFRYLPGTTGGIHETSQSV